ncbi:hypothetical protein [Streptomyces lasalocidi]|uniref:Uncharacterized protein n=1 Tax=Streptomyces lasalocidi TaxID=324833 RepID=A0A4V6XZ85_STRLS|nr:hypothetical protein E4U91_37075 [Streptomyces lasalocidi]
MTSSCCAAGYTAAQHDAPNPIPLPHQTYVALVGGPLDGLHAPEQLSPATCVARCGGGVL